MNEKIIFRRNPLNGVLSIVLMIIFVFNGLLRLSSRHGGTLGLVFLAMAVLYLFLIIWMFSTPFAVIEDDCLTMNAGPLNKKTVNLSEVKSFDRVSDNKIELHYSSGGNTTLHLRGMAGDDKEKFVETLRNFIP
jgi:hypothetical protein